MIDLDAELRAVLAERADCVTVRPDVEAVERDAVRDGRHAGARSARWSGTDRHHLRVPRSGWQRLAWPRLGPSPLDRGADDDGYLGSPRSEGRTVASRSVAAGRAGGRRRRSPARRFGGARVAIAATVAAVAVGVVVRLPEWRGSRPVPTLSVAARPVAEQSVGGRSDSEAGAAEAVEDADASSDAELRTALLQFAEVTPFFGGEDAALYGRVRGQLVIECMAAAGFDYTIEPHWERDEYARMLNDNPVLRPIPPIAEIRRRGYEAFVVPMYESAELLAARAANQQLLSGQAAWSAMEGPGAGAPGAGGLRRGRVTPNEHGCTGAVYEYMNDRIDFRAFEAFSGLTSSAGLPVSLDETSGDPDVDALTARWQSCMRDAGFPDVGAGPYSLPNRYNREVGVELTPEEIAVAVADATCQTSTGFHDDYVALTIRRIDEWFAANEGAIVEVRAALDHDVEGLKALADELGL